jgi:hypothetical protein
VGPERRLRELFRSKATQRAVRPYSVVVESPCLDRVAGIAEIGEPVLVQTLVSELAVEAFDEAVLDRLARANEAELDASPVGPGIHRAAHELRAVVGYHCYGFPSLLEEPIQDACDPLPR